MKVLTASAGRLVRPGRPGRPRLLRVGAVQHRWHPDPTEHRAALAEGVRLAAGEGARLVCLQELTLSPYFAVTPDGPRPGVEPEPLEGGPTATSPPSSPLRRASTCTRPCGKARPGQDLGYNTAIVVAPDGRLASRTRKLHIPITAGYYEDRYFEPGPAEEVARRCRSTVPSSLPHLLGPVVPRAGPGLRPRRHRRPRLPDRHRLGARPPQL